MQKTGQGNYGGDQGNNEATNPRALYIREGLMSARNTPFMWSPNPMKRLPIRHFRHGCGLQNLDAPRPCPYTSAVPEMDCFLDPREGACDRRALTAGGWKRNLSDVAAL